MTVLYKLPDDIDKAFRLFISETHDGQFKKGLLMTEFVNAVKCYMASKKTSQNTHAHAHNSALTVDYDVPPNVQKLANKVIEFLQKKYGYEDLAKTYNKKEKFVNLKHLKDAIMHVKGTDPRTIKQGIDDLKGKVIKENGGIGGISFDFAPFGGEHEDVQKV